MGQVAFDTQEFVETLENSGLPKDQARAISIAVRKSHEVADVATKADIVEVKHEIAEVNRNIAGVRKDLSAEIADVRKDMEHRFEKVEAQIADVRKDMEYRFEKSEAQLQTRFEKTDAQISLVRKDMEALTNGLLIKLSRVIVITIGVASTLATLIIKIFP